MCLIPDRQYPHQPDGTVRFKLMKITAAGLVKGTNRVEGGGHSRWDDERGHAVGDVRIASPEVDPSPGAFGIHVCADEASFNETLEAYVAGGSQRDTLAKVKVECRGFLHGGAPDIWPYKANVIHETWREVTILEITRMS